MDHACGGSGFCLCRTVFDVWHATWCAGIKCSTTESSARAFTSRRCSERKANRKAPQRTRPPCAKICWSRTTLHPQRYARGLGFASRSADFACPPPPPPPPRSADMRCAPHIDQGLIRLLIDLAVSVCVSIRCLWCSLESDLGKACADVRDGQRVHHHCCAAHQAVSPAPYPSCRVDPTLVAWQ